MDRSQDRVVALAHMGSSGNSQLLPRIAGSSVAGVLELAAFHPVDTVAKRLMSNQRSYVLSMDNVNTVIFKEYANEGFLTKYRSLFPGVGFAAGYKVLQRTYKFGGQPYVKDIINKSYGSQLQGAFGEKTGKTLASAIAGSIVGVGEVFLLPLDVLKIKSQTNPQVLAGRGVVDIFVKEGFGLYRGWGWTAARNAPGSFALFGGSAVAHNSLFKLKDSKDATFFQNFVASICGAVASITVAAPLDVVKTRIQNRPFDSPETGVTIIKRIVRHEGLGAFFKGLTPKILVVGPKLVFSYTIAQTVIARFQNMYEA